uniref:Syntaphilin a n=1 Tax=Salarias fasciatus TaxID=181472 RepID=A0A672JGA3_SALFA
MPTVTPPARTPTPVGSRLRRAAPRRQAKHTSCSDNHGIRPPTPDQYLTPLQQKEVCIRHLRARLRENVERLQHRDCEIDELRTQLYRMQEDWIEEECHRVEAQLALKEARREIQHLQEVVESVKTNLSVREQDAHDHKPYSGLQGARPGGRSRSCGCSPASTLTRGATHTRLSSEALQLERGSNAPEASGAARPAGQTHLLLEAALLSEQLPPQSHVRSPLSVPRSSTYERLCSGGAVLWLCEESVAEQLSVISSPTLDVAPSGPQPPPSTLPPLSPVDRPYAADPPSPGRHDTIPKTPLEPRTRQPRPVAPPPPARPDATVLELDEDSNEDPEGTADRPTQRCHWSRYFLVDLLALAMPVVPTMAWLCRGAPHDVVPVYHIGSLLRGCCAVALHSLRRQGAGRGRRPTSMNGATSV